jgi:tetratricopeptide (TPR) repeat protein
VPRLTDPRAVVFGVFILAAGATAGATVGALASAAQTDVSGSPSVDRPPRAANLRDEGLAHGYNLDYDLAFAAFERAIAADPTDSASHRLYAATAWISLLFEQGAVTVADYLGQATSEQKRQPPNPAVDRKLRHHLDRAITLALARVAARPDDADAHYQAGAAYALQASYTSTIEGRVFGSLGPARRASRFHQQALARDSSRKDAGLTVGLYAYGVSVMPLHARLVARLAGFSGGRDRAVRLVEDAADYTSDAQTNAMLTLALIYNRERRYDDALRLIRALQRRYPKNRLLWLEEANTLLRAGRPPDARSAIEQGLAQFGTDPRPKARGEAARWHYVHGSVLAALDERELAARALRTAVAEATHDWIRGRSELEMGKVSDRAGDQDAARAAYRRALKLCSGDKDDECSKEARRWLK